MDGVDRGIVEEVLMLLDTGNGGRDELLPVGADKFADEEGDDEEVGCDEAWVQPVIRITNKGRLTTVTYIFFTILIIAENLQFYIHRIIYATILVNLFRKDAGHASN